MCRTPLLLSLLRRLGKVSETKRKKEEQKERARQKAASDARREVTSHPPASEFIVSTPPICGIIRTNVSGVRPFARWRDEKTFDLQRRRNF